MIAAEEISKKKLHDLNGTTGTILTVFSCIVTLFTQSISMHAVFTIWLFLLLMYYGLYKKGLLCLGIYLTSIFWLIFITPRGISFPSPMLFGTIYKLILPMMPAILTANMPSGKVLASLRKIPMPKNVILVLVVLVRFAPTVGNEFREIREAMRIRGFIGSIKKIFHPLKTLEYAVVPMIFRSIKIADELAAASIVRGIESPCYKESYYSCSFKMNDFSIISLSLLIGTASIIFRGGM